MNRGYCKFYDDKELQNCHCEDSPLFILLPQSFALEGKGESPRNDSSVSSCNTRTPIMDRSTPFYRTNFPVFNKFNPPKIKTNIRSLI